MPTTEMRFSDLTTASVLNDDDILALSKVDQTSASGYMSYKATMIAIGLYITKLANYTSDLQTTNKTIIGAINELKQLIALIPQFDIQVVEELPTEDISETTIYMVPSENPETENAYDEFIYVDDEWEQVGSTAVDLSAYYTKLEVDGLLDLKESKADMEEDVTEILEDLSDDVTVTGNPVTFETINGGMAKSCEVTMNPIQDLHGQSAPYPAGGGKNKLPMTLDGIKTANTSGSWNGNVYSVSSATFTVLTDNGGNVESITVNGTPSATVNLFFPEATLTDGTAYKLNGCPSGGSISTYALMHQANSNIIDSGNGIEFIKASTDNGVFRIRIQSGYTCNNLLFKPMLRFSTEMDATFAPYSNNCPISGWNGLNLMRNGVNQWDEEWELGGINTTDGQTNNDRDKIRSKNYIKCFPSTNYYLKCQNSVSFVWFYDENKAFISFSTSTPNQVFVTPSNCHYMKLRIGSSTTPVTTYNHDISINYPSTDTEYHAYNGATYTATFEDTIMGGSFDFVSGDGSEVWKAKQVKDYTWSYNSSGQYFATNVPDKKTGVINVIFEALKTSTAGSTAAMEDLSIKGRSSDGNIYIKDYSLSDVTSLISTYGEYYFAYELDTPISITTTPTEISLNKGDNLISTDADALKLVASKLANVPDLLTYIQSLEARIKALEEA